MRVTEVYADKLLISEVIAKEKEIHGIILAETKNDTPIYQIEKVSNTIGSFNLGEFNTGEKIIVNPRSTQYVYREEGKNFFIVRVGDILAKVED